MIVRTFPPHGALREYVSCLLYMHLRQEPGAPPVACPFPPTPQQGLMFYLDDPVLTRKEGAEETIERPRTIVLGPQVTRMNVVVRQSHRVLLVGLHPGGVHRLLGIPMPELFDDGFDARDLIGPEADLLVEAMQEASTPEAVVDVAQRFLLRKLDRFRAALPLDLALRELVRADGNRSIESIAGLACLSLRQFERKCVERVGLSPKLFARIIRFSAAYRLREAQPDLTWTAIAHASGYFDQMHFIRDFRQFAGVTPRFLEKEFQSIPYRMQADIPFGDD